MNKSLKNKIAYTFLITMIPFVILAILAIWDVLDEDVAWRSISTIAVLGGATILGMITMKHIDKDGGAK